MWCSMWCPSTGLGRSLTLHHPSSPACLLLRDKKSFTACPEKPIKTQAVPMCVCVCVCSFIKLKWWHLAFHLFCLLLTKMREFTFPMVLSRSLNWQKLYFDNHSSKQTVFSAAVNALICNIFCCLRILLIFSILLLLLFLLADAPTVVRATIGLTQSLDTTGQVRAKEKGKKKSLNAFGAARETEENRASV